MPSIYPNTPIILASGSQSRRVMLEDAGIHFSVISSNVDEDLLKKEMDGFPFEDQVVRLAAAKASEVSVNNPNHLIIGGDQMCIFQNKVFDKPGSQEKAIENLKLLSGTTHYQYSGVCLYQDGVSLWNYCEIVELNMHSLTDKEIVNYVKDIYSPFTSEQVSKKIAQMLKTDDINAEVEVIYQSVDNLHKACPDNLGDWYFTGNYPTPGGNKVVNKAFINWKEDRNERAY